ncbi:MAG: hypothetical protein ACM3YE_17360 [Bacteroidota bacterium]
MKSTTYGTLLGLILLAITTFCFAETINELPPQQPATLDITIEQKRSLRVILLEQMIVKYEQQQVFDMMRQYMNEKSAVLEKDEILESPQDLIRETLERTRAVYEKVQPFVGNQFKKNYNPEEIEAKINKFAWLKGPAFLILGIKEKHKIALSFFYLPENENIKWSFLHDAVQYSYPEVLNVPENETWFDKMNGVMERLGYKFFNVEKYIKQKDAPQ